MSTFEHLAAFWNDPANLPRLAVLGLVVAVGVALLVWTCWEASKLPARRRPQRSASDGRETVPPTRLERILREDAASRPLTRSQIKQQFGVDVHDVFGSDDDRLQ